MFIHARYDSIDAILNTLVKLYDPKAGLTAPADRHIVCDVADHTSAPALK